MKYIKPYRIFESAEYDLEDAKHILISHLGELEEVDFIGGDLQVQMSDRLRERIRVYRLLESPNVRNLNACEDHLVAETEGIFWNVNLDWYSGKVAVIGIGESIESFLGEWLRERFPKLEKYVRGDGDYDQVFYMEDNGSAVFYFRIKRFNFKNYYEGEKQDKSVYVYFQKIWGFFSTVLCLEDRQIRKIVHNWLKSEFGLDLEPKKW